jgi:hypothetical protein
VQLTLAEVQLEEQQKEHLSGVIVSFDQGTFEVLSPRYANFESPNSHTNFEEPSSLVTFVANFPTTSATFNILRQSCPRLSYTRKLTTVT